MSSFVSPCTYEEDCTPSPLNVHPAAQRSRRGGSVWLQSCRARTEIRELQFRVVGWHFLLPLLPFIFFSAHIRTRVFLLTLSSPSKVMSSSTLRDRLRSSHGVRLGPSSPTPSPPRFPPLSRTSSTHRERQHQRRSCLTCSMLAGEQQYRIRRSLSTLFD